MAHQPVNQVRAEQRLPQREKIYNSLNIFDYDETKRPRGYRYEWKRCKIAGMEDEDNMIMAEQNGWVPVPASRHPELSGNRRAQENPNSSIVRRGLMLMEIPEHYYQQSQEQDRFAAEHSLESQIQRLGLQARRNGARGIGRTREQVDVPISRRRSGEGELVE